ncbi:MAG: N-acetylmuramoyl-L-alanine amidase [Erysipelotrichaceae bacterium]|nr:N-acetylmuramoyl-L-alanine amidase [Erysipelotrichaceae bacterium]
MRFLIVLCLLLSGCSLNESSEVNSVIAKVILVDPGHGGLDNGASYDGVMEDDINLKVGLLLQQILLENNMICLISRNGDYDLSSLNASNHKAQDLKRRVSIANDNKVDLFVSLHLNVYLDSSVSGAQVFYQKGNNKSKLFASVLQDEVNTLYDKKRKIKEGDFYLLNNSSRDGVLIEMGFLSSFSDRQKLVDENFQLELAKAIFKSIKSYFLLS